MHDVFSDPFKSAILYYLDQRECRADLQDVANRIATWCRDGDLPDVADAAAEQSRTWLLHEHVLAMDEFGLITYDASAETISLAEDVCVTVEPPGNDG